MKIKLIFAAVLLTLVLLPSCRWQNNIPTDASDTDPAETTARMQSEENSDELEITALVFDASHEYDYANLYYDPVDVYCYDALSDAQKEAYRMLAYAVDCIVADGIGEKTTWTHESDIMIFMDDVDTARSLFCANYQVLKNTVDKIEADCKIFKNTVILTYINDASSRHDVDLYLGALDMADELLGEVDMTASVGDIAHEIAKNLSGRSEYDAEYLTENCVYGMLADKKGICQGFAYTYDFLCKKAGLNTVASTVTRGDFYHVWCLINIDGEWYNVDPTWMTTMNDGGDYFLFDDTLRYRYQRATSAHTCYYFDHTENKAVYAPECTDASENEQ